MDLRSSTGQLAEEEIFNHFDDAFLKVHTRENSETQWYIVGIQTIELTL